MKNKIPQLAFIIAAALCLGIAGMAAFEAYVRWYMNQNYTVLGEGTLSALIIAAALLILGLLWDANRKA